MTDEPIMVQPELPTIEKVKSKYTFEGTERGVLISRYGGFSVEVLYNEGYIHVGAHHRFSLYDYQHILDFIAQWFLIAMQFKAQKRKYDDAVKMIAKSLNSRFHPHWEYMVKQVAPPEVAELSRLMWSSTLKDAVVLHIPELYTDEYKHLRADLKQYHACRLICKMIEGDLPGNHEWAADDLPRFQAWRERVAMTVPNKFLNKTLDRLPQAISVKQLVYLPTFQLTRPIVDRLHLLFALSACSHHHWGLHELAVLNASGATIQEAAHAFGFHSAHQINVGSKTELIAELARNILDYPQAYRGNLVGLAERSAEWHQERRFRQRQQDYYVARARDQITPETPLPRPDIDLDALAEKGVRFLATFGDVQNEGNTMGHCMASSSYDYKAYQGKCYLFHVDDPNSRTQASVEVDTDGEILQAYGPGTLTKNAACTYGVNVLKAAFKKVRENAQST